MGGHDSPLTLLTLPPEIRNTIYDFAFSDTIVDVSKFAPPSSARNAGIVLACRQTHSEAINIYYKRSIFFTPSIRQMAWVLNLPSKYQQLIEEFRCVIDAEQDFIRRWSQINVFELRCTWRERYRSACIARKLEGRGIYLRSHVIQVDVPIGEGEIVWTSEPENWMPQKWMPEKWKGVDGVDEDGNERSEWEIEELPTK